MSILGSMRLLNAIENETIGGVDLDTYLAVPRQFNEFQALLNTRVYRDRLFSTNGIIGAASSTTAIDMIINSAPSFNALANSQMLEQFLLTPEAADAIVASAYARQQLVGVPVAGGFFMGFYMHSPTERRALIDAGKDGEFEDLEWKTSRTDTPDTDSEIDGYANTLAMTTVSQKSLHPAAAACADYRGGGKNDWSLPAQNQLEVIYRQGKPFTQNNTAGDGANPDSIPVGEEYTTVNPSQTSATNYRKGGAQAYDDIKNYWTSTQDNATNARLQQFGYGSQNTSSKNTSSTWCRAVRSFKV